MILLLLVLVLLASLLASTVRSVRLDGYGARPPTARHPADAELPSRPYAAR